MYKISIPKPCHESWDNMLPATSGRYCESCAKTVVDFTGMSDEAVSRYFFDHREEKICGRFRTIQLDRIIIHLPENIFQISMPLWKRFLVAFLLAFCTAFLPFDVTVAGNTVHPLVQMQGNPIVKVDSNFHFLKSKKKHPRKIKAKYTFIKIPGQCIPFDPRTFTTLGFTVTEPINMPIPDKGITIVTGKENHAGNLNEERNDSLPDGIRKNKSTLPRKNPFKKYPSAPVEAVLPIAAFPRKKSNEEEEPDTA